MLDLILAAALIQAAPDPCQAIGAAPPASARCRAWRALPNAPGGGEMFADPASVQRSGDGFEIMIRIVFPTDRADGGRSGISLLRFECRLRTYSIQRVSSFTAAGAALPETPGAAPTRPALLLHDGPLVDLLNEFCPAMDAAERRAALQRPAGEWRSVSRDSELEIFVDTVPAGRSGDTVTVRTMMVFSAVTTAGVRSSITSVRFNCAARTASSRHMIVFRDDGVPFIDTELTGDTAAEQPVRAPSGVGMLSQFCPGLDGD